MFVYIHILAKYISHCVFDRVTAILRNLMTSLRDDEPRNRCSETTQIRSMKDGRGTIMAGLLFDCLLIVNCSVFFSQVCVTHNDLGATNILLSAAAEPATYSTTRGTTD